MKRIITPIVLGATALTLSACGGGSFSHASSAVKAAVSNVKSAASSPTSSTSPSASSTTASSPTSSSPASSALIDDATFKSYAEKLGCSNPTLKTVPSAKAKQTGAVTGIDCYAGAMEYAMVRTKTADSASKVVNSILDGDSSAHGMPYVLGTNWVVLANKGEQDTPTKADAEGVQAKIGGEVKTLP